MWGTFYTSNERFYTNLISINPESLRPEMIFSFLKMELEEKAIKFQK